MQYFYEGKKKYNMHRHVKLPQKNLYILIQKENVSIKSQGILYYNVKLYYKFLITTQKINKCRRLNSFETGT